MNRFGTIGRRSTAIALVGMALGGTVAFAEKDTKQPTFPTCEKKIGTLSVVEPEDKWWVRYNLESPEALIKVFVAECKCFTLVDRGKGLAAPPRGRAATRTPRSGRW